MSSQVSISKCAYSDQLELIKAGTHPDYSYGSNVLITPIDVVHDKNYYVVFVVYSTGDSFSTTEGLIDYVEIYNTREEASECRDTIRRHYDFYKEHYCFSNDTKSMHYDYLGKRQRKFAAAVFGQQHSVKIKNGIGIAYEYHCPWMGYFESIENVVVARMQLA